MYTVRNAFSPPTHHKTVDQMSQMAPKVKNAAATLKTPFVNLHRTVIPIITPNKIANLWAAR